MPHFDFVWTINAGQALLMILLSLIGWGLRKIWKMVGDFLRRTAKHELELQLTMQMVDRHTVALRKAALMGPPAQRLYRRRIDDQGELDILDEPA